MNHNWQELVSLYSRRETSNYFHNSQLPSHYCMMDIVFNVNRLGLEGLGATLTSLLRNCSDTRALKLHILCSDLSHGDKENISRLLMNENFGGTVTYIDINPKKIFGHLRSLHGDWTSYGRLLIPKIIDSDKALYLDADLVVGLDVLELSNFDFNGHLLGAVYGCAVKHTLDSSFLTNKLNWSPETGYFNAGVVLFNLKKWRAADVDSEWNDISSRHPLGLISHDQTILNAVCRGSFAHLPNAYNLPWYSHKEKPENAECGILHFVGSPKPWDFWGQYLHKGFHTWKTYNTPFWKNQYCRITSEKMKRTWKIRRSLAKGIKKKAFSG